MLEFTLWSDNWDGDRRISFNPAEVAYYQAVEKKVLFGGYNQCTKITLNTGEAFVVTSCYDVVKQTIETARREEG